MNIFRAGFEAEPAHRCSSHRPAAVARQPEDLIAYASEALGFWPTSSLVLLVLETGGLQGGDHRNLHPVISACLRLDLPASRSSGGSYHAVSVTPTSLVGVDEGSAEEGQVEGFLISQVIQYARSLQSGHGPGSSEKRGMTLLALFFSGTDWVDGKDPGYDELIAGLAIALAAEGHSLGDSWWIGDKHWRDYLCRNERCCPWPGYSLAVVQEKAQEKKQEKKQERLFGTESACRGGGHPPCNSTSRSAPGSSRSTSRSGHPRPGLAALADPPALEAGARRAARTAFLRAVVRFPLSVNLADEASQGRRFREVLKAWEGILDGSCSLGDNPQRLGYLTASLADRSIRDAVLMAAAGGKEISVSYLCSGQWAPEEAAFKYRGTAPLSLSELLFGISSMRGSPALADPAVDAAQRSVPGPESGRSRRIRCGIAMRYICRLLAAPEERGFAAAAIREPYAAALTVLAWLEWRQGHISRSRGYLLAALEQDPEYKLAMLFKELFEAGLPCLWASGFPATVITRQNRSSRGRERLRLHLAKPCEEC